MSIAKRGWRNSCAAIFVRLAGARVSIWFASQRLALLFYTCSHRIQLARRTQLLVFMCNKVGVFLHENFPRRAKIEFHWMVAEVLAMHPRPDQPAIGIDVDFRYTKFCSG